MRRERQVKVVRSERCPAQARRYFSLPVVRELMARPAPAQNDRTW